MNFCSTCGAALVTAEPNDQSPAVDRRPLTIMFCDLVGSTAMSERLDPEELQEILTRYQEVCIQVVSSFDGHIAQYLGDGVLIYFGYPQAHEDDAQRAVHAALGVISEMAALNDRLGFSGDPLQVRIGIHTGPVVTGGLGPGIKERLALGQAPNIAARIQGMAKPDTVAVSEATYQLVEGYFRFESLGTPHMKGVSEPMEVFRVSGQTGAKTRFDISTIKGLNKPVGRDKETSILRDRFAMLVQKHRQVVLIHGEAGIGKSRLVSLFHGSLSDGEAEWIVARCSAYAEQSAFAPIVDSIEHYFGFARTDTGLERREKVEAGLSEIGLTESRYLPVIGDLLELPPKEGHQPAATSPEQRKQAIISTIIEVFLKISRRKPLVFLVEDLHWADPSTLDLLAQLARSDTRAPVLALFTFRPGFAPPPVIVENATDIELDRLSESDVKELVQSIAAPNILPGKVVQLIVDRTDGVPLFVEELTKTILESDQIRRSGAELELLGSLDDLAVPKTLHSSLVASLDRLGAAKELAQLGSVLGREFSYELLRRVYDGDESTLGKRLDRLEDANLLMQIQSGEYTRYGFRHALIQDAAYDSLLKKDRIRHHHRTARELVEGFPETCETRPELVAHHFTRAGIVEDAIDYWQKAGERAVSRFANAEAIAHYSRALKMLAKLDESRERALRELVLQTELGAAHSIHDGWQAPATANAYERAYEICKDLPDAPELFWVLWQLGAHYQSQEIAKGHEIALQLVRMAEAANDADLLVEAKFGLSAGLFLAGRLAEAYENLAETEAVYDSGVDRTRISPTGQNIAINNLLYFGMARSLLGDLQGADESFRQAVDLARSHAGPPHQAAALCWRGFHFALHGDTERTLEDAESAVSLATDFFLGRLWAETLRGWAHARQGIVEDGIREMSDAIDAYRGTGIRLLVSWLLTLQADGLLACGKYQESIETAEEALTVSNASGEEFSKSDLYRVIGDARRKSGALDGAADSYRLAMEIAEAQGANTLVLKASVGLGQLLVDQKKRDLARDVLIKGSQAFDKDTALRYLNDARHLLQTLS